MTQEERLGKFKRVVSKFQNFGAHMSKAAEELEEIGVNTDIIWGEHNKYVDLYLDKIVEIMNVDETGDLISDEWFWAEWTSSETCFMFVLGLTAATREENEVQQFNAERRKEEKECLDKANKLMRERL